MSSTFAAWLNDEIRRRGWSLRGTARRLGYSHTTIIKVANEEAEPGIELVKAVAKLFGVPVQEALRLAGVIDEPPHTSEDIIGLIRRLEAMPGEFRAETLVLLNAIIDYRRRLPGVLAAGEEVDEAAERLNLFRDLFAALDEDEQAEVLREMRARAKRVGGA